jgi:hypothetical protein
MIRQLLGQDLITVSDVTNMQTPPGQKEYLPTGLTLKGQRLLDKANEKSALKNKKNAKKKKRLFLGLKKLLSGVEMKWIFGIAIAIAGLFLNYKYNGAEDLRNKVYSPLYADLDKMQTSISANGMGNFFSGSVLSSLKQSGEFNRMPKSLQREVSTLYDDEGQLQGNIGPIVELVEREISQKVETVRSEQEDHEWLLAASARIRSQDEQKPGISASSSFTATHSARSRGIDVRDPSHPIFAGPGGPEFDLNDWLAYPESLKKVDPIFGDDDYLYFDATDTWYYRITRSDLLKKGMALREFLEPIHDTLARDAHFKHLLTNEPGVLERVTALKAKIADRMDSPKRIGDLFD